MVFCTVVCAGPLRCMYIRILTAIFIVLKQKNPDFLSEIGTEKHKFPRYHPHSDLVKKQSQHFA